MRVLIILFLAIFTGSAAYGQCDFGEKIIKLGSFSDADHLPRDKGAVRFRDTVNSELQGKACVEIISNEARFKGTVGITALQNGEVQMLVSSFKTLGQFSSAYRIFDLPFAFRDLSSVSKFQTETGNNFVTALSINGLQPLAFWHGNFKQISGKRAVYFPVDVAGLKFRSDDGESFARQISALNATSQTVLENDLTAAIKSGKVDMQISNWVQLYADGTARIFSGVSETNHGYVGYQLIASKLWWSDLDEPLRKSLSEIVGRVSRQLNFETANRTRTAKQNLMRNGVAVRALTQAQRAKWKEKLRDVWSSYESGTNRPFLDALVRANTGL